MASTVDQKIPLTPPGNSDPGYLCNVPPNFVLDQDMTTDLDRIVPPTHHLVGETDLSSTNTNTSWEQLPEDMSGGSRFSKGEEDAIDHLDDGECTQGHTRRTRAKVDSGGVPHSTQVMSPKLSEIRKLLAEYCKDMDIGTNAQRRILSLEGDQNTLLALFEEMF